MKQVPTKEPSYVVEVTLKPPLKVYSAQMASAAEALCAMLAPGKPQAWVGLSHLKVEWHGEVLQEEAGKRCLTAVGILADHWPNIGTAG